MFSLSPFFAIHQLAKFRQIWREELREGRLLLMMEIAVSSAKRTAESGGKPEGRSLMKAEKREGPSTELWGTPEVGKPREEEESQNHRNTTLTYCFLSRAL